MYRRSGKARSINYKTIDYEKLGYQTGEIAIEILKGKEPNQMPIETIKEMELIVNKKMADKYKVDINSLKGAKIY